MARRPVWMERPSTVIQLLKVVVIAVIVVVMVYPFLYVVAYSFAAPEAADAGLRSLSPLGVMVILGARTTAAPAPLLDLIVGNRIVAGSVNASPAAFRQAAADLPFLPAALTGALIERTSFGDYRRTLTGAPPGAPKVVHVMEF